MAKAIEVAEKMTPEEIEMKGSQARQRIKEAFEWDKIVDAYEQEFMR